MSPLTEPTRIVLAKSWDLAGFDADAAAYIQRVEWADTTPLESATRTAINNFVVGCKADGTWNAIKASCILAGARTIAGALMPLVGPAPTNVGPFTSVNYDRKLGITSSSGKYINTNRSATIDPQNSRHIAGYLTSLTTKTIYESMITSTYATGFTGMLCSATNAGATMNITIGSTAGGVFLAAPYVVGLIGGSRSSSTSFSSRSNKTNYSTNLTSQTPDAALGNYTAVNGSAGSFSQAFYSAGESLDLALLDTRVTALITAIGTAF